MTKLLITQYALKAVRTRKIGTKLKENIIQFTKKNEKDISLKDVKQINDFIAETYGPDAKVEIRALNIKTWWTIKNLDRPLNFESEDQYYTGKVRDVDKYLKYAQLQIRVISKA